MPRLLALPLILLLLTACSGSGTPYQSPITYVVGPSFASATLPVLGLNEPQRPAACPAGPQGEVMLPDTGFLAIGQVGAELVPARDGKLYARPLTAPQSNYLVGKHDLAADAHLKPDQAVSASFDPIYHLAQTNTGGMCSVTLNIASLPAPVASIQPYDFAASAAASPAP